MLGRTFTPEMQARELDVRRSLYLTLRHGMMPQLVFRASTGRRSRSSSFTTSPAT